ncbi:MAG: DHH family phosphoesterase [Patescibacteria group bacterium]
MDTTSHLYGRLHEELRRAGRVLLVAHKKPDGDTLGASSAMLMWLAGQGKQVTAFCADKPAPSLAFLDCVHLYTDDPAVFDATYDVVMIFDSGDLRYCGVQDHVPRLPAGYLLVNIDHHATNERYGHMNIVLPEASSTSEIMHRFFAHNNIALDPKIATALLTGIYFDTSNFSNASTRSETIAAASHMLSAGAHNGEILHHMLHNKSIDMLRIWGVMLSRLRHNTELDVVSTYILEADSSDVTPEAIDGAANFLNSVVGDSDTIMVLRELPGGFIKGSFRSIRRDVSKLAKLMGGGGHRKAAGFTVPGRIEETPAGPRIVDAARKED